MARKDPPLWYAELQNRLVLKLNGVRLDPIVCAAFFLLSLGSLARGVMTGRTTMYYSAAICALAGVMIVRRIRRIRQREKEENNKKTEEKNNG